MEEFDCKKCLHEKVCALWASRESQNASCFCTDGCDYFTPTLTPPNEPLTQADLNEMYLNEVWLGYPDGSGETALVVSGKIYSTSSIEGAGLDLDEYIMGETLNNPTGNYKVYRRPPEGEDET